MAAHRLFCTNAVIVYCRILYSSPGHEVRPSPPLVPILLPMFFLLLHLLLFESVFPSFFIFFSLSPLSPLPPPFCNSLPPPPAPSSASSPSICLRDCAADDTVVAGH